MKDAVPTRRGGQLFGLPISRVQDVFMPDRITRVPLSVPEIAGVLNLRGRIVTAVDMRQHAAVKRAITKKTKLLWIETPANPTWDVIDIKAAAGHEP